METINGITQKCCNKCGNTKSISKFARDKSKKSGYASNCKDCKNEYNHAYYELNGEKVREQARKWHEENREHRKEYKTEYWKRPYVQVRHKEIVSRPENRARAVERKIEKYHEDPETMLKHLIRTRFNEALKQFQLKKKDSFVSGLGCTISFWIGYLESMFYANPETGEDMTWENRGMYGWHIDHIIPLASAKGDSDKLFELSHYTNTQPMWAKENWSKGCKIKKGE